MISVGVKGTIHVVLTIVIICFILWGCNTSSSGNKGDSKGTQTVESAKHKERIKLRWMGHWFGEGKKELMIRELAREFSLINQDIEVELTFPHVYFKCSNEELYTVQSDSMAKMVKRNEWPFDVMFCDQARYWKIGDILKDPNWGKANLVDFYHEPWYISSHKPGFLNDSTLISQYGGIAPGSFLEGVSNILYCSTVVESKLGINVRMQDMNFSDFKSYAKAVFDYNQSHTDKVFLYSLQYWNSIPGFFSQLAMSAYGKSVHTTKAEGISALEKTYSALEQIAMYKPILQSDSMKGESRKLFHEQYLFTFSPSWMYLLWQQSNPLGVKSLKPCELPSLDNMKSPSYSGGYNVVFVVPKNSKHVEAAKRFIKFISSTETAEKWIKYSKCPTGLKSKLAYTDFGQDQYEKYYRNIQNKYGNNQLDVDLSNLFFKSSAKIDFKINEVLNGTMTAKEALNYVLKQIH